MKGLLTYKILFILLIFMSSSLTGGTVSSTNNQPVQEQHVDPNIQDTLYKERIQNINRLEQMKYVVQKMAN